MIVQSRQFKHTNIVGNAFTAVDFWNEWTIDEIVLLDVSRDMNSRKKFHQFLLKLSERCFVPLSVGGWITTIEDCSQLLSEGADKVVINTIAYKNPQFITELATKYGSQFVTVSIDVKGGEVIVDRGNYNTHLKPVEWAKRCESLGAGEIFLTSIDNDGMLGGYDLPLISSVSHAVSIPIVASGGAGNWEHLKEALKAGADAISVANKFHHIEQSTKKARNYLLETEFPIREASFVMNNNPRKVVYDER